jgi:hypothetical protein
LLGSLAQDQLVKSLCAALSLAIASLLPAEAAAQADAAILTDEQVCQRMRSSAARQTGTVVGPATLSASVDCSEKILASTYQISAVPDKEAYARAVFDAAENMLCAPDAPLSLIRSYGYRTRYVLNFADGTSMGRTVSCD